MFIAIQRSIKTALTSLWRNRWLSLTSTFIMVVTLFIISAFVSLSIVTNKVTEGLKSRIDMAVYIHDTASSDQVFALQKIILAKPEVLSVIYTSKEDALKRWQDRNVDNEKMRNIITDTDNPLPRSFEIKTNKPEDLEMIASFLEGQDYSPLIKQISYRQNKVMIDRLVKIANFVKIAGSTFSLIFIIISIMVVYNTLKLTIFARSDEIEIMKLVGATDWYVRAPFIIEALFYGVIATIVSSVILYGVFQFAVPEIQSYLGGFDLGSGYMGISFVTVVLIELAVSLLLAMGCSVFAIKKHLK